MLTTPDMAGKDIQARAQPEESQRWVNLVKAWYRNSKAMKANRQAIINKCYEMYGGRHYSQAQRQKKHGPKSSRNYIFSSVEDALALLTDGKPQWDFWPRESRDVQLAEKMKQVMDYVWEVTEMSYKVPMALRDHFITGFGVLKFYFDPQRNYPYGEIVVDVVHPDHVYFDPDATGIDMAKYVIQATPTPLWLIRKMYPERGHMVTRDNAISLDDGDFSREISAETTKEAQGYGTIDSGKHERTWLIECYLNEFAEYEDDELEYEMREVGLQIPQERQGGAQRIVVAGDILLEAGENPFQDGQPPFVMFENYEQTNSAWPLGDVEFLIEPQQDINKIVSRLNEYIRSTCHTIVTIDDEAHVDENSLSNIEGVVITKRGAGNIGVHPPPNWPPAIFQTLTEWKSDLEIISGIREVLQGRNPQAGESGVAFERLQEFALSRIRKKARNVDHALVRAGKMTLSRVRQFYNVTRQIRITGDFPITQADEAGNEVAAGGYRPYDFAEFSNSEMFEYDESGNPVREIEFDVVMATGAAQSVTRNAERQEAAWLYQSGVIDKTEVARRFDVKNFKEIQARIQQEQYQQMMMAEQAKLNAVLMGGGIAGDSQGGQPVGG